MRACGLIVLSSLLVVVGCSSANGPKGGDGHGSIDGPDGSDDGPVDADGDGFLSDVDCDDSSDTVFPGADELCNSIDDDCDRTVDEDAIDAVDVWADLDGDGYGDPAVPGLACEGAAGWADNDLDCDDDAPEVNPETEWYVDADDDGFGDETSIVVSCEQPPDAVLVGGDCDDSRFSVYPGAEETCNGRDMDCNGVVDDGCGVEVPRSAARATWTGSAGMQLGTALAVGDYDGDGKPDLLLGAETRNSGGTERGGAYVVYGPQDGAYNIDGVADAVVMGRGDGDQTGFQVATIDDWNGDGADELVVGAWGADMAGSAEYDGGAAYIFHGPIEGQLQVGEADAWINGGESSANLSKWILDARGDHNDDGVADLLAGGIGWEILQGGAWLFQGPIDGELSIDEADAMFEGTITRQYFGYGGWIESDFNGDGYDDFISGTPGRSSLTDPKGAGEAWAFYGPFAGHYSRDDVDWLVPGEQFDDFMGTLAAGGDFDGDGYEDAIVTAKWKPGWTGEPAGAIYLFRGGEDGLEENHVWELTNERPWWYLGADNDELDVGDIQGDGIADLLVGWMHYSDAGNQQGAALVFFGPLEGSVDTLMADRTIRGPTAEAGFGEAAKLEDMDGDGLDDVLVGARRADFNGQAWLFDSSLFYE